MLLDSESDDDEQVEIVRRPRIFRKRINFRFQSFFEFYERFRLSSVKMEVLSNIIGHRLQHEMQRNYALSVQQQSACIFHNICITNNDDFNTFIPYFFLNLYN
jgi:hypothetical protein